MTTTTELQAFLAPANDLTERDLNDAINELISLATHKFGRCVAIDDLFSMMITPDMDDELGGEVG